MPDTRPGIKFMEDGICAPCHHYEKQKKHRLGSENGGT